MVASAKTIVISGYYGFRNSGDEAVLKSILTALEVEGKSQGVAITPVVLSIDPESTSSTYGVRSVHRMKLGEVRRAIAESDGLISGGGSLLQDATSPKTIPYYLAIIKMAQWAKKPTFIYAQGVGPVNRKWFHPMIRSVFRKCTYISVRDPQSAELLRSMGISPDDINVVADPVMGLPLGDSMGKGSSQELLGDTIAGEVSVQGMGLENSPGGGSVSPQELPVIGISVRFWDSQRRELNAIAEGLTSLMRSRPVHIRFLPFHQPDDEEASRYITERMGDITSYGGKISFYLEEQQPQDMLREVSRCQLVLGMRLHSLIYAANQSVPLIGISYDPKIDHFLRRLDSAPVGSTDSLQAEDLKRLMISMLEQPEAWKTEHQAHIDQLKLEAGLPARQIVQYLGHRG
ncbi:polysaccharide pyruvyl transferase CsaB [Paenibacillus lemnae]|uniref:Polysaccharide pyruvyl transferase CsaB n=1 Tax=Paenibacillus lemnae TaxID=1330551 RepID=A0A848MBT1_PAELE|nr:polysaccharide pyruvyl transferase CsaB [Paenibacillus lemnae]NMO98155.1 polysaccharide pyruvyl transferase CsaB [Paenibacillus lemnae]